MKFDRITIEPGKMSGQPCIRGYRFTVSHLLRSLAVLKTREALLEGHPFLEDADIDQALVFAAACLPTGTVEPPSLEGLPRLEAEPVLSGALR